MVRTENDSREIDKAWEDLGPNPLLWALLSALFQHTEIPILTLLVPILIPESLLISLLQQSDNRELKTARVPRPQSEIGKWPYMSEWGGKRTREDLCEWQPRQRQEWHLPMAAFVGRRYFTIASAGNYIYTSNNQLTNKFQDYKIGGCLNSHYRTEAEQFKS